MKPTPTNICPECGSPPPESPTTGDDRVVLVRLGADDYDWPVVMGEFPRPAIRSYRAGATRKFWATAWETDAVITDGFLTPALAAARLGARLPGEDDRVVLRPTLSPGFWEWPDSTRTAIWPNPTGGFMARKDDRDAMPTHHTTLALALDYLGASPVSETETPDLDTPAATDQPTPRERELLAQVEAQAGQIRRLEADHADRYRDVVAAHAALDKADVSDGGPLYMRIRILANRQSSPLSPKILGIVAQILARMEHAIKECDPGRVQDVRELRLALEIES